MAVAGSRLFVKHFLCFSSRLPWHMKETATGRAPRQSFYNPPYSLPFLGIPIPYLSGILGEGREQKNNRSSKIRIKKLGEKGRMSERGTRNQHLFWIHYLPGTVLDPWTRSYFILYGCGCVCWGPELECEDSLKKYLMRSFWKGYGYFGGGGGIFSIGVW